MERRGKEKMNEISSVLSGKIVRKNFTEAEEDRSGLHKMSKIGKKTSERTA